MKDRKTPCRIQNGVWHFPDNQTHKDTAGMKRVFFSFLYHRSQTAGGVMTGLVRPGLPAFFPECRGCVGYVSSLWYGFLHSAVREFTMGAKTAMMQ